MAITPPLATSTAVQAPTPPGEALSPAPAKPRGIKQLKPLPAPPTAHPKKSSPPAPLFPDTTIDTLVARIETLSFKEPPAKKPAPKKEELEGKGIKKDEEGKVERKEPPTVNKEALSKSTWTKLKVVTNVHNDDIHALLRLSEDSFVSGSKDGSLKIWDLEGKPVKQVFDPGTIDYHQWITALGSAENGCWMSGTRNGLVDLWDGKGEWRGTLVNAESFGATHKCKERNHTRVNHLSSFPSSSQFFVGWPTQFTMHTGLNGKLLSSTQTSKNDWVYVTHPISDTKLLVVTGSVLELWNRSTAESSDWRRASSLIPKPKTETRGSQRLFISAIQPLKSNASHFGLSIFDGRVKLYDIVAQKAIWETTEHSQRVWAIENITDNCFASCADDGLIKLWDPRIPKSFLTLRDDETQAGRVSVLMHIKDTQFLSGSCPNNVRASKQKAQFSFWDLRKG